MTTLQPLAISDISPTWALAGAPPASSPPARRLVAPSISPRNDESDDEGALLAEALQATPLPAGHLQISKHAKCKKKALR